MERSVRFAVALTAGLLAAPVSAATDTAQSRIAFTFVQMKVPVEGAFQRYTASIHFNAEQPERSRAEIDIDLNSIDTGSSDADTEAKRKPWFYTAQYPTATFRSTAIRRAGEDRYEVSGALTLKGRTRNLTAPVEVRRTGAQTVYEGVFSINRLDFSIGDGPWADIDTVANEVKLRFRFVDTGK
jgi:polyisoprenoid-binding protein YceI